MNSHTENRTLYARMCFKKKKKAQAEKNSDTSKDRNKEKEKTKPGQPVRAVQDASDSDEFIHAVDPEGQTVKLMPSSIYLLSEAGDVLLPSSAGYIANVEQDTRYEVCGDEAPTTSSSSTIQPQNLFRFGSRPVATAACIPERVRTKNVFKVCSKEIL
ncbi:hypothetical protein JOB18_034100 [Solea senegalensis]|uniref:Uncharacterized protein n=1 Tax=Solea senegalensis TaxID=28829 RepID=A0AAV6RPL5_SOLSE|nr:hypothetical protein JOB18_034100 [Solea senegalensis]